MQNFSMPSTFLTCFLAGGAKIPDLSVLAEEDEISSDAPLDDVNGTVADAGEDVDKGSAGACEWPEVIHPPRPSSLLTLTFSTLRPCTCAILLSEIRA